MTTGGTKPDTGGIIRGIDTDDQGRCAHWDGPDDVVAFRFPCCDGKWACRQCHDEMQDHEAAVWPKDAQHELAVQCGACYSLIAIGYYLDRAGNACPHCGHAWNPACRKHTHLYFET